MVEMEWTIIVATLFAYLLYYLKNQHCALTNARALSLDCRKCMKLNLDNYFTNADVSSLVKY
jgi:hypothetical protein